MCRVLLAWLVLCALAAVRAHSLTNDIPRPSHTEHARLARWLAHSMSWGILSTQGDSGPAAGVVSFADGPLQGDAAGRLFFYLTPMDETGHFIKDHPDCVLSISEAQMFPGGCGATDPMDPTCARISVLGRMLPVASAEDKAVATDVLFSRHPAMKTWPADHGFKMFELHISTIHMLDWYGGMHIISAEEYFAADLMSPATSPVSRYTRSHDGVKPQAQQLPRKQHLQTQQGHSPVQQDLASMPTAARSRRLFLHSTITSAVSAQQGREESLRDHVGPLIIV